MLAFTIASDAGSPERTQNKQLMPAPGVPNIIITIEQT